MKGAKCNSVRRTRADRVYTTASHIILLLVMILLVYPIWAVVVGIPQRPHGALPEYLSSVAHHGNAREL